MILRLLIIASAVLLVAATVRVAWEEPSPGVLSRVHESLAAPDRCGECHDGTSTTEACLGCHTEIAAQRDAARGLHHAFVETGEADCAACHGEHYGDEFQIINERSWLLASPDGFDHEHVAFALRDAHDSLECETCHRPELAVAGWPEVPGDGTPRNASYLGLVQDCVACHENVHGPTFEQDCAGCHDQHQFLPASGFDHAEVYELVGAHGAAECADCHQDTPCFEPPPARDCRSCHPTPHESLNEQLFGEDCQSCHDQHTFLPHHYEVMAHRVFPLLGGHARATCLDCHREHPGPLAGVPAESCESCHEDPHAEGTTTLALVETGSCARCHHAGTWQAETFGRQHHIEIGFPLAGDHAGTECAACHVPSRPLTGITLSRCDACHPDPHTSAFEEGCASCHLFDGGVVEKGRSRMSVAAHALTPFPLQPPHAGLECRTCHGGGTYADRFPGRAASNCVACHQDVHAGQFAARGQNCSDCHSGPHFLPTQYEVERHVTFPLVGSHLAVACVTCHTADETTGVRRFVDTPQDCRACHENPHGEEFRTEIRRGGCTVCHTPDAWTVPDFDHATVTGRCADCHNGPHRGQLTGPQGDCNRCHDSVAAWLPTVFDHDRHSRYRLEGVHRLLDCHQCHGAETFADGGLAIRYRPLGMECGDCHEVK